MRPTSTLDADVLDRIDEIVPPGTNFNRADAGVHQPQSLSRRGRRRVGPLIREPIQRLVGLLRAGAAARRTRRGWRADLVAGLTRGSRSALPLALAFGITTGMGAEPFVAGGGLAGLVAGVYGWLQRPGPDRPAP